ncbi:synaptonemal complex central element protein 2 [Saimiri boliviensis]|uniref:synaptonemal complex central element protein 2 n=1 Tax=Saimiri boliviensis TaxID=27679 RepID=UPI003D76CA84
MVHRHTLVAKRADAEPTLRFPGSACARSPWTAKPPPNGRRPPACRRIPKGEELGAHARTHVRRKQSSPGAGPAHAQRVDVPHVKCKDQEPQPLGESNAHQQFKENREEEAGGGPDSASRQLTVLEGKSGLYFSSLDSSIDILQKRAQELIENINESRQKDHALMTNFRNSLKTKVSDLTEKLEERIYQIYNDHNKIIQEKLQEFTQKMAKISHLETELKQVCHSVETVYKDLCLQPEHSLRLRRPDHSRGKSPPRPSDSQPPDMFVSSVAETTSQVVTSKPA